MNAMPDIGSMSVSAEALARFGRGDAKQGRKDLRLLLAAEYDSPTYSGPTARPPTVRVATEADEEACLELLLLDLAENANHIAPMNREKVLDHIRTGTRGRGGIVGVIDGPEQKPVAIVILLPQQWWWSDAWYLLELVNFVHPDHRKSQHVNHLLDFSKWASDHLSRGGFRFWLLCGVLGAWRVQAKIWMYRRKFQQCGAAFIYPAPPIKGN